MNVQMLFLVYDCCHFKIISIVTNKLVQSLKSSILSSTSFQMGKAFWGVVSAAVEQSRLKANMVAQGDGKFSP